MQKHKPYTVSCRSGVCKAIALAAPGAAEEFSDFRLHRQAPLPEQKTTVRLIWEGAYLKMEVHCFDTVPEQINACNTENGMNVWQGDGIELFFGALEPEYHQRQLFVGAGGGRFDSFNGYDGWNAETRIDADGWHAVITIPLAMLKLCGMKTLFNITRQTLHCSEYATWSDVRNSYGDMAEYGELFFCSYDQAFFLLTGIPAERPLPDRASFEKAIDDCTVSALEIKDKPVLIQPGNDHISVFWRTMGRCAAAAEYRIKGESRWQTGYSGFADGFLDQRSSVHRVELTGLKPGVCYEYRVYSIPQSDILPVCYEHETHEFTFPGGKEELSVFLDSDVHSKLDLLEQWLKLGHSCNLMIHLGDQLANRACTDNFFAGFLRMQNQLNPEQPLLIAKGNHEQDGTGASDCRVLNFVSGRAYDCFTIGNICFMVLDSANDHEDGYLNEIRHNELMLAEERTWISETIQTPQWKNAAFRVVLVHIPPFSKVKFDGLRALKLAEPLSGAAIKPDLMISGHIHAYGRWQNGKVDCADLAKSRFLSDPADIPALPYPVICNSDNTALEIRCNEKRLAVRAIGEDGKIFDSWEKLR